MGSSRGLFSKSGTLFIIIIPLALLFLEKYSKEKKKSFNVIHKDAEMILYNHDWEGNVRELQNTIERVVLLYDDNELKPEYLRFLSSQEDVVPLTSAIKLGSIVLPPDHLNLKDLEREITRKALKIFKGNKTLTAQYLGLSRSALRSRLE